MVTKTDLHKMVDDLPDEDVEEAARRLTDLNDRLPRILAEAEEDDEALTAEEERMLAESDRDIGAGRVVTHEEARRRLLS